MRRSGDGDGRTSSAVTTALKRLNSAVCLLLFASYCAGGGRRAAGGAGLERALCTERGGAGCTAREFGGAAQEGGRAGARRTPARLELVATACLTPSAACAQHNTAAQTQRASASAPHRARPLAAAAAGRGREEGLSGAAGRPRQVGCELLHSGEGLKPLEERLRGQGAALVTTPRHGTRGSAAAPRRRRRSDVLSPEDAGAV